METLGKIVIIIVIVMTVITFIEINGTWYRSNA